MPAPPKKPFDDRLAEIEAALPREDPWERPTQAQIRRIEERTPGTYPPKSETPGPKRWTPAGVAFACTAVAGACVTVTVALTPILTKPDLSGYVKEERLTACEAKLDARQEANEKWREEERGRTGKCYQLLGDCRSQNGASQQVIESMGAKRKRTP